MIDESLIFLRSEHRLSCLCAACASRDRGAADERPKAGSIEKYGGRLHKGEPHPGRPENAMKSPISGLRTKIQKKARVATVSADLPQFDRPKGDLLPTRKMAKTYAPNARNLATAAKKETSGRTKTHSGSLAAPAWAATKPTSPLIDDGLTRQEQPGPRRDSGTRARARFYSTAPVPPIMTVWIMDGDAVKKCYVFTLLPFFQLIVLFLCEVSHLSARRF